MNLTAAMPAPRIAPCAPVRHDALTLGTPAPRRALTNALTRAVR